MLSLNLLWRNWRSGELKLLATALLLAVAVVSAIGIFTQRLELALVQQSNTFLGADRIVRSSEPFTSALLQSVTDADIRQAQTIQFSSMTFAGERMHLASVKAVNDNYPLLGKLDISEKAFSQNEADLDSVQHGPSVGEAWVDARILPLLGVEIGDMIGVGELDLKVSKVIVREPDRGDGFSLFGARVMIHIDDIAATEVIQPGSRIQYNLLLAAKQDLLDPFLVGLKDQLTPHQKLINLEDAQRGLSNTLKRGRQFLSLAAMIGLLLAGLAIAIAAAQFSRRHTDQVALLKSLGASARQIRGLYVQQLLVLGVIASVMGLLVGEGLQRLISAAVMAAYPLDLSPAGAWPYVLGLFTGLLCLLFFAIPPLWKLPTIPPIKVLRREMQVETVSQYWQGSLGVIAVFILVALYSRDMWLTLTVIVSFFCILSIAALVAVGLLKVGRRLGSRSGSSWRLAWASLLRHRRQTVAQMLVFGTAIMLLMVISVVRSSLIDEWRFKLAPDAPNHFFVNIAPSEVSYIEEFLAENDLGSEVLYPMVRARLVKINNQDPDPELKEKMGILNRESNLSWSPDLPLDNALEQGVWWPELDLSTAINYVSVEQEVAERLGLKLGDHLGFSVGGLQLDAQVSSIRSLDWDTMRPNFYFLFSPGALDSFSPTYLTSAHIPPEKKPILNTLLQHAPTISVLELDLVIEQIQSLTAQVSDGVELVLVLVLLAGIVVLLAAVNSSMDYRLQEAGILRALGSSKRRILGSTALEFFCLGAMSGLLAVLGAEVLLLGLQYWVLETPLQSHPELWVLGPLLGGCVVALMGVWASRRVVTVPPMIVLREL